jgi:eukaryotic-like serine/threonine-protein kinase
MTGAEDPIAIADALLDAALGADAELVRIRPHANDYEIRVARHGETLAAAPLASSLALPVITRLGYVCHLDPSAVGNTTGRTRVRTVDTERDVILTIHRGAEIEAELLVVRAAAAPTTDVEIGDRIGHFRVTRPIGAGGMGSVYEVEHEKLGRKHALKVLQNWARDRDRECIERFVQEAQTAARIRSPHIVEVFDLGFLPDGRPYFVMELLGGASLADVLAQSGPLPVERALGIARQLAQALTAAHERDVCHADVSPSNIFLTNDHVTLIDFGLAQLQRPTSDGRAESVSGTPSYLAPERITGHPASEASDQYAFGVVLFELLTGRPPFVGETAEDICVAHLQAPVPQVTSPHASVPAVLARVVTRCLAKDPNARFASMREVHEVLS